MLIIYLIVKIVFWGVIIYGIYDCLYYIIIFLNINDNLF